MKLSFGFKFSEMSRREKGLTVVGALVLSLLALDQLVLGPWWQGVLDTRKEIRVLEESLLTQKQLLSREDRVMAEMSAFQKLVRFAGSKEVELATLLREIESFGRRSGLALGEVKPLPTETDGPYQERAFQIEWEGSASQWVRFVYMLETSSSLYQVDQATVNIKDKTTGMLEGRMRLTSIAVQAPTDLEAVRPEGIPDPSSVGG